ncbi:hypothetical protein SAMN05443549_104303 [Flavobacterium fluvii]|uniref:Uncharacterized protein n=1 Tax=Flavobacterium fluvii TaxID=468056 RepID=A0A1M5KFX0_9FLAO|nr:hypothetical protein [Flavobacterium fluvii]SHG51746.1 hypothetical protein SAMN05443549_104303 [Flavobacterium fluvii]
MKNFVIKLVWFATGFVFIFTGLCQVKTPLTLLMSLFLIGSFLVPFMVYKVLTDDYTTFKTFKDWYEDNPTETLDEE